MTAADLAAANGHSGLAAFLGESLLNELLANLKIENRRLDGASLWDYCTGRTLTALATPVAHYTSWRASSTNNMLICTLPLVGARSVVSTKCNSHA